MNKPFTELPAPLKERVIIRVYFTKAPVDSVIHCEACHMSRVSFADKRPVPPECGVCGRLLCWPCFGDYGAIPGPNLTQVCICDSCAELEIDNIHAILELREKLSQP